MAEENDEQDREFPKFSRRLGAPITTVKPVGKPPSQVSGLPKRDEPRSSADLGYLPPPGGEPLQQGENSGAQQGTAGAEEASSAESNSPASRKQGPELMRGGGLPVSGPTGQPVSPQERTGPEQQTFYDAVGGHETFKKIVDVFYAHVAEDEDFRAMYPEEDLEPAKERLLMFLEQYWGGPRTYQERRGHPRLRMRHMPFRVDAEARDKWLAFMRKAVDAADLSPMHEQILWDYLERAAHSMVNS